MNPRKIENYEKLNDYIPQLHVGYRLLYKDMSVEVTSPKFLTLSENGDYVVNGIHGWRITKNIDSINQAYVLVKTMTKTLLECYYDYLLPRNF